MTPAQRKYDIDLVASMQKMASWIEPRSRKVSDTLRLAAERISALASSLPVDQAVPLDAHGNKIQPNEVQLSKIQPIKPSRTKSSPRQHRIKKR
jgi:hypothetical protein